MSNILSMVETLEQVKEKFSFTDHDIPYMPLWAYVQIKNNLPNKPCCANAWRWGFLTKDKKFYWLDEKTGEKVFYTKG